MRLTLPAVLLLAAMCLCAQAQTPPSSQAAPKSANPLANQQQSVADRFERLESLLLRSSELETAENPTRAALLQQAAQLGKQTRLADLLARAANRLGNDQFTEAIDHQKTSREGLKQLLELLQSENRGERVREKRDQVRRWIEETDRLLRLQGSLRGRTEGGQDTKQAAADQQKLANKASDIAGDLGGEKEEQNDENAEEVEPDSDADAKDKKGGDSESKPGESPEDDAQSNQPKDGTESGEDQKEDLEAENKTGEGDQDKQAKEPETENPNTESPDTESPDTESPAEQPQTERSKGQQGKGQQGNQSNQSQPPQDPTQRAQQKIQQAQDKMDQAQKALEDAQRDGAIEQQREAEEKLREAIDELREILRQLREEEIERSLASLETRLRRMLEMQIKVRDETSRLQEIAGDGQGIRQVEIRASKLSLEEKKILSEGERAFLLLREEGSSAAFPEAVEQLNIDVANVADRLGRADVSRLTVVIEEEIIQSLEEMVEALVQVQKQNEEKKQQQQQGRPMQQGQPGDQPLVDKLAELRLIRTLQIRINKRTETLSEMLDDPSDSIGQSDNSEILGELRGLSQRQSSIQSVTRDIVVGKGE